VSRTGSGPQTLPAPPTSNSRTISVPPGLLVTEFAASRGFTTIARGIPSSKEGASGVRLTVYFSLDGDRLWVASRPPQRHGQHRAARLEEVGPQYLVDLLTEHGMWEVFYDKARKLREFDELLDAFTPSGSPPPPLRTRLKITAAFPRGTATQ
jgi:hypothetical protein